MYIYFECGKFRRSRAIVGLVGLEPSCHGVFGAVFCRSKNFFSWVFHGSEIFSREYFKGPNFFLWIFYGFEIFSRVHLVGLIFFSRG